MLFIVDDDTGYNPAGEEGIGETLNHDLEENDNGNLIGHEAELKTFTETVNGSPIPLKSFEDTELDEVPTKYISSEMNIGSGENEMGYPENTWKINLAACQTEFVYSDFDTLENELGEIYGYYELSSLSYNFEVFHMYMESKQMEQWTTTQLSDKISFLDDVLDDLELADEFKRSDALLGISYLIQGCWKDLETSKEQLQCIEESALLLLRCNGFLRIWSLLTGVMVQVENKSEALEWGLNERIMENCLNILCTITNVALRKRDDIVVQEFLSDIIKTAEGDSILSTVFNGFVNFVIQLTCKSYLLKKLLLLARNLVLLSAGDSEDYRKLKDEVRQASGLNPCKEDTVLNCRKIDILQRSSAWIGLKDINMMTIEELDERTRYADEAEKLFTPDSNKSLPWSPKSSLEMLGAYMKESHLYKVEPRLKIPITMRQRVRRLLQHLHVPLSNFQLQEEELIRTCPKAFGNQEVPLVDRTEQIFLELFPILEQSLAAMMLVLNEATPPSHPVQMDVKNIKTNLHFIPQYGGDSTYFVEDSFRQAEIIVKAISAILILFLKHSKLNHIYQFECIASETVAACYIPTFLRYFNGDVNRHVCQQPFLQHPNCPFKGINMDLCLHQEELENMSSSLRGMFGLSWRNTFSHINLLRVLNKVVKGKPSRILMLRMFKAQHCLIRSLNVKDSLFQQYTLKVLKHLCKFMDQEWKRNNQRIISAIYHKVRHRLLEDWIGEISSNKVKKRTDKPKARKWPWEYKEEEVRIHQNVILYLGRRYGLQMSDTAEVASETTFEEVDLPESFKSTYERWVEQEVFGKNIAWDNLLNRPHIV